MHYFTFNNNTIFPLTIPPILPPRAARVTLAQQGDQSTHRKISSHSFTIGRKTSILKLLPFKYNTTTITLSMTTVQEMANNRYKNTNTKQSLATYPNTSDAT